MKYIRTDTAIYDIDDLYVCEELNGKPYGVKGSGWLIYKESIRKEADTIKELCDEFVGISDGEPQMLRFVPYACAQYWNGGVYGAIWTKWGLKYVAKVNEKGELVLL